MIEFAKSPAVNIAFDAYRRSIYGDKLMTNERLDMLIRNFTDGMKRAAINSMRTDPYYGIKTTGRTGARVRFMLQMSASNAERAGRIAPRGEGRVFKSNRRHGEFLNSQAALLKMGRNAASARAQAIKNARRASA